MAKKESSSKIVLERSYTIPLSRDTLKVPGYRKAKRAVRAVRMFLSQHMKSEDIRLGRHLNMELWKHGMQNPPSKVKVDAKKDDAGVVRVELTGAPKDEEKVEKKPAKKADAKSAVIDAEAKVKDVKTSVKEIKEEKAVPKTESAEATEKEDVKELKKEVPKKAPKAAAPPKKVEAKPNAPQKA